MTFILPLVYCLAAALMTTSAIPVKIQQEAQPTPDSYTPQALYRQPVYETYIIPTTNLELPKAESSQVPFYVADLSTALRAPQYSSEPNYYQVPIPSQDLVAPVETVFNPDNDPKFYYEVPAVLSQQETPTNFYPKKFNKDLHTKAKPYASKPKQEIVLNPIDNKEYLAKQKVLTKVYDSLAKQENQKEIQVRKLKKAAVRRPHKEEPLRRPHKEEPLRRPHKEEALRRPHKEEPQTAETGFFHEGEHHQNFDTGLSADITASLGITSPHSASSAGERIDFHMQGHDGPHTYKWGFDTGKGHNRQFRYEEKDKSGVVKGHFGYYDKHGKLQIVNYDAHPHDGYHVEGN